jgi:hypothetical protein
MRKKGDEGKTKMPKEAKKKEKMRKMSGETRQ